ncbi:hypothetical protein CNECB9_1500005 [Cupriavidus necator]|uniref:Uncharacterized protein n=1 Tax=Cupriavidus necator TaxID=106590 RepID=A0A1K0I9T3_CUPNE|nr:hypothetical protein CNECB9_1500005 [Cupriavidus necator]
MWVRNSSSFQRIDLHDVFCFHSYIRYKTFDRGAASDYNRDVTRFSKPNYSAGSHA